MPNKIKEFNDDLSLEDENFITIEGESFEVVQTTPPKDLLIKASKLHSIQEDLKNSVLREKALRERNVRILESMDLEKSSNEEIDELLKESYVIEEKIDFETEKQNGIFNDIFSLAYGLLEWSLGNASFNKIKEYIDSMGAIELANKAYEAISKNKTLRRYMKTTEKTA